MTKEFSDAETEVAVDSAELAGMVETNPELEHAAELLEAGCEIAERYRIVRHLGAGGMGNVYLAEHTAIGKQVAIKTLNLEFARRKNLRDRFLREARSASQIRHPNVVDISDFGSTSEGAPFIAMEYLDGEDLHATLEREGRLPFVRARHLTVQICRALQAAHDKGIVHRDVKPANCFRVEHDGAADVIKVVDFGIAKTTMSATTDSTELTKTGVILGTAAYMSPEQARGETDVDARADVYSVGVLLFRMLSGHMPYKSTTPLGMITKHLTDPIPSLLDVAPDVPLSREIDALVTRALAKDRDERWQSARELAEALERVDETKIKIIPVKPPRRRASLWIGGGVLTAALIGGAAMLMAGGEQPSEAAPEPEPAPVVEPSQPPPPPPPGSGGGPPEPEALPTTVTVKLVGAPDDAVVRVGEREIGPASEPFVLDRSSDTVSIEISAPGYLSSSIAVVPLADLEVPAPLQAEPEPEPVAKSGKKRPKPDKSGGAASDEPPVDKEIGF